MLYLNLTVIRKHSKKKYATHFYIDIYLYFLQYVLCLRYPEISKLKTCSNAYYSGKIKFLSF